MFLPAPSHVPDYEFWGIPKARMFFGLNVVDNDYFVTKAAAFRAHAEEWRPRLRAPQRYVLGVGRQIPKKNWHGLLEAWRRFKQMRPKSDLELVLVGNGPERQALVSKAETAGKSKDVHFHDFASQEVMPAYYALAEALILPSHGETWGLVVNEAMACGLPILVSLECGCAATLVVPGENGWTFPANETQALMQVLLALEDTPSAALERMGQKSWAIINEWGLQRFCAGAWDAVQSARAGRVLPISLLDLLVFKAWDGRYRPV
jgi:glycosyltransferase involved in cell wall biosynthesis